MNDNMNNLLHPQILVNKIILQLIINLTNGLIGAYSSVNDRVQPLIILLCVYPEKTLKILILLN